MKKTAISVLTILLLAAGSLTAQELSGRIEGKVLDPAGAVIPGASVTATHLATNSVSRATTGPAGRFAMPKARLGLYNVAVEFQGFRRSVVQNVLVEVGSIANVTVTLQIGAVAEEVVVTADAAQEILNTLDAEISTVVDQRRVLDLPLDGRNAVELALLQTGVFFERDSQGSGAQFNIHGQRDDTLNITLNGIDVQDQISRFISVKLDFGLHLPLAAENIQEFQVVTGIGSAENNRGGAQVSAVTRAGGNDWHGSIFEFHRNDKFRANTFFNNAFGLPVPKLIRNQFGGRVGGPIIKDKTFFFFGYQQTRQSRGIPVDRMVYTEQARQGIFRYFDTDGSIVSVDLWECGPNVTAVLGRDCVDDRFDLSSPIVSGNRLTPDPFIMNEIFDPAVVPLPNNTLFGDGLNTSGFRFNARSGLFEHIPSFRLDHIFSDKHAFYATYNYNDKVVDGDFINGREPRFPSQGSLGLRVTHSRGYSAALTSTFTPSLVNEGRFGMLRGDNRFQVNQPFDTPFLLEFNIVHPDPTGEVVGDDRFIYDDENMTESRITETIHVRDVLSWVRGNHQFKFGGEFRHRYVNFQSLDGVVPYGEIDFNDGDNAPGFDGGDLRDMAGASRTPPTSFFNTAEDFTNDLLGTVGDVERAYNVKAIEDGVFDNEAERRRIYRNREIDLFFNDTWQIRPNLTANFGLRWEYSSVPVELRGVIVIPEGGTDATFGVSGRQGFHNPGVFAGHGCDTSIFPYDLSSLSLAPTDDNARDLITGCATRYVQGAKKGIPFFDDDYNNLGPVVSFAWDPWGDGKTALRAGFRLTYIQDAFAIVDRNLDDNEGLSKQPICEPTTPGDCLNDIGPNALLRDLIGTGTPQSPQGSAPIAPLPVFQLPSFASILDSDSIDFRTFDRKLKTAYYEEWTFGIQREVLPNTALEVRYVGNRGIKLRNLINFNEYNIFAVDPNTNMSFLDAFLIAQANLACNRAVGAGSDFRDRGNSADPACLALPNAALLGDNDLMDVLIAGDASRLGSGTSGLRNALDRNEPGEFLDELTVDRSSRPSSGQSRIRGGSWWGAVLRGDLPVNFFRANPFVSEARSIVNNGFSTYHALEVEVRRRMSRGLMLQANYTFGRAISDSPGLSTTLFTEKPSPVLNPGSTIQEIAPRHQFNANWVYELPFGPGKAFQPQSTLARKLLEGWQTGGLIKWRSGRPISILSGRGSFLRQTESGENTVSLSQPVSTADLRALTGWMETAGGVFWMDPCLNSEVPVACTDPDAIAGLFVTPTPGEIGQLKQTPIFGPTRFLLDFNLAKRTKITETVEAEFRWEVFNLTNTTNFDIPNIDIFERDTQFGQISKTITESRLMQFVLKINF